jgi:hypothetical protein
MVLGKLGIGFSNHKDTILLAECAHYLYVMNRRAYIQMPINYWFISLLTFGIGTGCGIAPASAQRAPALNTIRLSPDDLERRQYGDQQKFFFLPPGKTGENYQSAGFFGQKLRPYLSSSPTAVAELNSYRRQKTFFLVDKALLVGAVGLYASQVFKEDKPQYFTSTQQVAAGMAAVSLLATLFINRHTNEYLKQAVDNYNTEPQPRHSAVWPRLRPAALGVAPTPQGQPVVVVRWHL